VNPDRRSPANIEAERSVIGAMLIDNAAYALIAAKLAAGDFFRDAHRKIYGAAAHLLDQGSVLDLVSLKEELDRRGLLEDVGGPAYIASMVDGVPRSTNIRYYGEIVKAKAIRRALIKVGTRLVEDAHEGPQTERELIAATDQALAGLLPAVGSGAAVSAAASMTEMNDGLARKIERRGQLSGVSSGWPKVDLFTHGWQRRKMVVIAADTSFGKTVFGLQTAIAIASAGERVLYYSLEMSRQDLLWRAWSMLSEIPLTQILWGNITTPDQFAALAAAQERLAALPLEINDGPSTSVSDMRAECRQVRSERGLGAVVLDYFQRMDIPQGDNRAQKLGEVSRQLQTLFADLEVTGFVLSQLTLDKESTREPQLYDLRDCKSLGHDADQVWMGHPYKVAEARTDVSVVPMKWLLRKNRGGHLGLVTLNLERDYVRFAEAEPPAPVVREPKASKAKSAPRSDWTSD
jgi:replicative DNA helicase